MFYRNVQTVECIQLREIDAVAAANRLARFDGGVQVPKAELTVGEKIVPLTDRGIAPGSGAWLSEYRTSMTRISLNTRRGTRYWGNALRFIVVAELINNSHLIFPAHRHGPLDLAPHAHPFFERYRRKLVLPNFRSHAVVEFH
jgi:hypothetical protein